MNLRQFYVGRTIGFLVVLAILGIVAGFYALNNHIYEEKQAYAAQDYKDAEYVIDGQRVRLTDGKSETEAAPGSASKIVTTYFGNEVKKDIDGDGRDDVVFLLTQNTGGSGTFFYVVAALNTPRGYVGSSATLLGDRVAPQTTESGSGATIIVNYADRAPGEPFTARPSMGKSMYLLFDAKSMQFGEVVKDFEGEADPSRMSLGMKTWNWISATRGAEQLAPKKADVFTLTFGSDGSFTTTTDCNHMAGKYKAQSGEITFSEIISTQMYCEGSQESDFAALLSAALKYRFTSKGELVLETDTGSVVFR
ncbi:META domain-containing protein [Candidatus Kaiserbacteria bacterium]|nr:META domain-containing protein [Candidatus Kaiserbacteria bacterium]